ncbi:hypothetical protein HGRIS_012459 [Hohenbuehelia grisea]|uniref:Uncharacterized protein n=1 Tax=Hohenbuehelia grisea TaxID=104357 RepID=A0ABR3ISD4_9AGAR
MPYPAPHQLGVASPLRSPAAKCTTSSVKMPSPRLTLALPPPDPRLGLASHKALHNALRSLHRNPRLSPLRESIPLQDVEERPPPTPDTSKLPRHTSYFPQLSSLSCEATPTLTTWRVPYIEWLPLRWTNSVITTDDYGCAEKGEESPLSENGDFIVVNQRVAMLEHKFIIGSWIAFLALMALAMFLILRSGL